MYFDPGTGSMLVQIILAALATCGAFFIAFKNYIINFFKGIFKKKNDKK